MTPDFKVGKDNKWFRQCVGIDIAKEKFNACLFMYDIASDMGCGTKSVEFKNTKQGFNQLVKWARKECIKEYPLTFSSWSLQVCTTSLWHIICARYSRRCTSSCQTRLATSATTRASRQRPTRWMHAVWLFSDVSIVSLLHGSHLRQSSMSCAR